MYDYTFLIEEYNSISILLNLCRKKTHQLVQIHDDTILHNKNVKCIILRGGEDDDKETDVIHIHIRRILYVYDDHDETNMKILRKIHTYFVVDVLVMDFRLTYFVFRMIECS